MTDKAMEKSLDDAAKKEEEVIKKEEAAQEVKGIDKVLKPVVETPVVEEGEETVESLHEKIGAILKEHDGRESDIGLKHVYWGYVNHLRRLLAK